ncbi:MAG: LAGLIDADG family homing endonuclease [Candidatus Pacebacteria bacterium]|nr:LAGLIDADG family homing endonuclease [Candidatus Paceibacterota bacterium]
MEFKKEGEIKWSSNLAYVIGLISTDGSLSKDGRHIDFTSKDLQLINTFKNCLGLKNKIGFKNSGFSEKKYPRIQFGNVKLYNWLLSIGLTPKKSKTLGKIKIPGKFFADFLRGFFDGDGCTYNYWDPRWKSSFMIYISFYSSSLTYLEWLRNTSEKILGIKGRIKKSKGVWNLCYAKKESRILFSRMYHRKNLPCLERKYNKIKNAIKIDNKRNGRVLKLADSCV